MKLDRRSRNERESHHGLGGGRCGDMRGHGDWGFDGVNADGFFGAVEARA